MAPPPPSLRRSDMQLPALEDRVEMFLTAVANRCKTCIVHSRCDLCLSKDAKRLGEEWRMRQRTGRAASDIPTLSEVEASIVAQVEARGPVRGSDIRLPHAADVFEKRTILQRLLAKGTLVSERHFYSGGKFYNYYSIPCETQTSMPQASSTRSVSVRQKDNEKNSSTQSTSD